MADIFFSYSSRDRDRVEIAHKALTGRGFDVFWDLQVPGGVDWDRWIKAELDQSRCAVVFWTANSAASDNVRHEVAIARKQGKLLQALLDPLDEHDLPMGTLAYQAVKLMDWRGDGADPEWAKLIDAMESMAMPLWLRQKVHGFDFALKAEQQRVVEADRKLRALEEAHAQEVATQGELRRERDRLREERDQLTAELQGARVTNDKLRALDEAHTKEASAQSDLRRERDRLKEERDRLKRERDDLFAERDRLLKQKVPLPRAAAEPLLFSRIKQLSKSNSKASRRLTWLYLSLPLIPVIVAALFILWLLATNKLL